MADMRRPSAVVGRKRIAAAYACAAIACGSPAAAHADDTWGGNLAAVSDYVYRGISQTRGAPTLQIGAYKQFGDRWSAGIWGSNVDFGDWDAATYEINATLVRAWPLAERWVAQTSYTRHIYVGERSGYGQHYDDDYDEWLASLTYRDRMTATIGFSPGFSPYGADMATGRTDAISYELTLLQPFGELWSFTAGAGHLDLRESLGTGYWFWSTGVALSWQSLQIEVLRIDTDARAERLFGEERSRGRWTASLMWNF
jgi:uncharacterized protein (TIGR02001 family)